MSYRKFQGHHLFTGTELLSNDHVLITNNDGVVEDIVKRNEAGSEVEVYDGVLSPGFVNCHCHLELSHMKDEIPENTGITAFLLSIVKKRSSNIDSIQHAIANAEKELINNGVVAVGDICNTALTVFQKKEKNLFYYNFIEVTGLIDTTVAERFEQSLKLNNEFNQIGSNGLQNSRTSIVPHAPYSVSKKLFELIMKLDGNDLISIHNQESEEENEWFIRGKGNFSNLFQAMELDINIQPSGKRSLQTWWPVFPGKKQWILVHNVSTVEEDLTFLFDHARSSELFFCLCPNANLYIGNKLPDVKMFLKNNCSLVIGTDSLASNHQLNILEELKTLQLSFPFLTCCELLQWATWNGARALKIADQYGNFQKGKKPGVVAIENFDGDKFGKDCRARRIL